MSPVNARDIQSQNDLCNDVFRWICIAAVLFVTPFAIHHIVNENAVVGILGLTVSALFLVDFFWVERFGRPPFSRTFSLMLMAAGSGLCIHFLGEAAVFWAFPLVVTFHFVIRRPAALILNAAYLVMLLPLAATVLDGPALLRFAATLFLTSVFASVFALLVDKQRHALEQQLITDPLTGAYNRRHLGNRIAAFVQRRRRYGHPASLIIFDIDHFKSINDNFGHDVGDRVLRILAETVKARIRVMDEIFRFGGEEFVILLPDTSLEQAAKLGQDITDMIADVRIIEGGPVSISCGIGELLDDEDAGSWLNRCDRALYQAKAGGRGRVCLASEALFDSGDDQVTEPRAAYRSA
ncbi:MAG: GGDEF domain-containing protein [Gammaproteobacteria bacterium]|nr:GGDEF domain-containing protein [Gammaproteobacteria bacterium]